MDEVRREQLLDSWNYETDAPETQEWREDLTPEELEYVDRLDNNFVAGVRNICTAILVRERIREHYGPKDIQELETIGDCCRLWLRDGSMYLPRLAGDGSLRLDPIDTTC